MQELRQVEPVPPSRLGGEDLAVVAAGTRKARRRRWGRVLRPALSGALAVATLVMVLGLWERVGGQQVASLSSTFRPLVASQGLVLPKLTSPRVLDPSYVPYLEQRQPLLAAIRRDPTGTPDERSMYRETPMSWFEQAHYVPERL
jgi:hypothetical protein